jgi:hypothetical protein
MQNARDTLCGKRDFGLTECQSSGTDDVASDGCPITSRSENFSTEFACSFQDAATKVECF